MGDSDPGVRTQKNKACSSASAFITRPRRTYHTSKYKLTPAPHQYQRFLRSQSYIVMAVDGERAEIRALCSTYR